MRSSQPSRVWRRKPTTSSLIWRARSVLSLQSDVNCIVKQCIQIGLLVNKNLMISTAVPIAAVLFLCFWVHILTVTLPDQIFQETNPSFVEINSRLQLLSHGIKSTDTKTWKSSQPSLHWRRLIDPLIRNWRFWNLNFKNKLIRWRTSWRLRKTQLRSSTATWTLLEPTSVRSSLASNPVS